MVTDLYLIRHGESAANAQPVVSGMRGDAGLTERGRMQARMLEKRLDAERLGIDWLYTSTLPRAVETATYVARGLELSAHGDDDLQELRPGDADGLSYEDWRATYPPVGSGPFGHPFHPFAPGGESWATFLARTGAALTRLVTRHEDQRVAAITHGGVLEASFCLAFGLGATSTRAGIAATNTSITHWQHQQGADGRPAWTLVSFNDAHHLTDQPRHDDPQSSAALDTADQEPQP